MNSVFIEDWGLTAAAALKGREFDRWCALFVKVACGLKITDREKESRAYAVFSAMKVEQKVIKSNEKYLQRIERTHKKIYSQNIDNQNNQCANTSSITNNKTITNSITNIKESTKENAAKPPRTMIKPTIEEVREYIKEKGYNFDPEHFVNYYESNGWKVGRNTMKSWRAACATWNKHNFTTNKKPNNERARNESGWSGNYTGDTL